MPKLKLSGKVFGRWTVLYPLPKDDNDRVLWMCKCECGITKPVRSDGLLNGDSRSCGCLHREDQSKRAMTHGESGKPEYRAWQHIRDRCYNHNEKRYPDYGGRGIKMCDRWRYSFENFLSDMGKRPTNKHSIDRFPNPNGDYEPSNCRWATPKEQSANLRNNVFVLYQGEQIIMSELARRINMNPRTTQDWVAKNKVPDVILLGKLNNNNITCK